MAADLPRDFVARPEEYDRLVHALLDDKTGAAVGIAAAAALKGAGGYGKATLATAVCQENGSNPDSPTDLVGEHR